MPARQTCTDAALRYAGNDIDRAAVRRKDPEWLAAQLAHPETLLMPVWRNRNLIAGMPCGAPVAATLLRTSGDEVTAVAAEPVFLGLREATAIFAVDLSVCEQPLAERLAGDHQFVDLRLAGPLMSLSEAALCAYARGMVYWHRHHGFCSNCGRATRPEQGGQMRQCTACERTSFPRTDPAVIMLVICDNGDGPARCLLGRDPRWPSGTYSTLAGFVEPGESLEEAVTREVFEESGVRVHDVTYLGSQPWPFPSSIMLGFRAQAHSMALQLDPDEVEDAQWFTAAQIRQFGEWGDRNAALKVPRRDSIARFLIDTWVAEQEQL